MILVTGSSGFVASSLLPQLKKFYTTYGIDIYHSKYTDFETNINDEKLKNLINSCNEKEIIVINLAASRFDFGASANDYLKNNVECHKKFLESLTSINVKKFIHISSVAALDGRNIFYSDSLNCDDAYRSTKYLQEKYIQKWCKKNKIELTILYPSAIFSNEPRKDTNIGKLQSVSKYIPFIPKIDVVKSLTYLPRFCQFILDLVSGKISKGKYLTIEEPSLTVSEIMACITMHPVKLIHIPFLSTILKMFAYLLYVIGLFGKIDLKLTPNRIKKLYSDTSYSNINYIDLDKTTYAARNTKHLYELLSNISRD